ncbi:MAG: hypothetical protein M3Q65_07205 [Chloroflexota bacterium]|nr:hypothetical protein [Chloroflexota bacterium]
MAQAVRPHSITITTAFEPRACASRARTKAGELKKEARQWRDGLAWSAKLELLGSRLTLEPPYEVTVNGYFSPQQAGDLPRLHDWFESIRSALSEALDVAPDQLRIEPGRVGYTPPFSPAHFAIVVAEAGTVPAPADNVICPSCGEGWAFDPAGSADDRCPRCGHEGGALPFMLGIL